MKLKNKRTGEIVEVITGDTFEVGGIQIRSLKRNPQIVRHYPSLAELNEEWEDVPEEPKEYWFLSGRGEVKCIEDENTVFDKDHKSIGNYFESREEAEESVRKLKAWKRLEDRGLKFELCPGIARGEIKYYLTEESDETEKDLRICFGGEE